MNNNDMHLLIGGVVLGVITLVVGAIIYYVVSWIIGDVPEDEE